MKFSELQQQLKKEFSIDHLADIARELGVSPQAVSNWKARDRVPYKYVLRLRKKLDNTADLNIHSLEVDKQFSFKSTDINSSFYNLTEIITILFSNYKLLIFLPSIFCFYTIINSFFILTPIYESSATLSPIASSSSSTRSNLSNIASQFGVNIADDSRVENGIRLFPQIIKSRSIARKMLNEKFDTEKFGFNKKLIDIYHSNNAYIDTSNKNKIETNAIETFQNAISVNRDREGANILTIKARAVEPKFSADILKTLINVFEKHQKEFRVSQIVDKRKFIEERISKIEIDLTKTEEDLKFFREQNRLIQQSPNLLLTQDRYKREVELLKNLFITLKNQYELVKIQEVENKNFFYVIDYPEIPLNKIFPKRKKMVIISGIFGLSLSLLIIFIKEYYLRNLKTFNGIINVIKRNLFKARISKAKK